MMKALIVEDERIAQAQISRLLRAHFPDVEVTAVTDSVRGTVEYLATDPPIDLIFMDIELSDGDCFEVFRQVKIKASVIMTTAYDTYALKAFEAGSIDYLLKPIGEEALRRAVSRCRERTANGTPGIDVEKLLSAVSLGTHKTYKERFLVYVGEQIIPVQAERIAGFFSEEKSNYLLTDEGKRYLVDSSLDSLEAELDPDRFFRISRGIIVSRGSVRSVNRHFSGRLRLELYPRPPFDPTVARARVDDFLRWLE